MKRLKRLLTVLTLAVMILLLTGCSTEERMNFYELDKELREEIKEDFLETFPRDCFDLIDDEYYYRTSNGYHIFIPDIKFSITMSRETIAGEIFVHSDENILYGWKDGTFTPLSQLYEEGKISRYTIKKIAKNYRKVLFFPDAPKVSISKNDVDMPFKDDQILVTFGNIYRGKLISDDFFGDGVLRIEDYYPDGKLTYIRYCRVILDTHSRENVVEKIREISKIPGVSAVDVIYSFDELPSEKQAEIKQSYSNKYVQDKATDPETVSADFFAGVYNGYIIGIFSSPDVEYDKGFEWEIIGDSRFVYPGSNRILGWKEGEFYSLKSLYDTKVINKNDLREIAYKMSMNYYSRDEEEYMPSKLDEYPEARKDHSNELTVVFDSSLSSSSALTLDKDFWGIECIEKIDFYYNDYKNQSRYYITLSTKDTQKIVEAAKQIYTIPGIEAIIIRSAFGYTTSSVQNVTSEDPGGEGIQAVIPGDGETSYSSFLISYYRHLTNNFGHNSHGSCGYVAIGMLLGYYDTFLNDSIIPEAYDVTSKGNKTNMIARNNSPGYLRDIIDTNSASEEMSDAKYLEEVMKQTSTSLHAKLISLGFDINYIKLDNTSSQISDDENTNKDNTSPLNLNLAQGSQVLTDYFEEIGLSYDCDINLYNGIGNFPSETVREKAIKKIQSGIPVLLSIWGEKTGSDNTKSDDDNMNRHAVIAYDYDPIEDKIYVHMGWGEDDTHVTPEEKGYTIYNSFLWIDWMDMEHSHSNNYEVTSGGVTTTHCYHDTLDHPDDSSIIISTKYHFHEFTYANKGADGHSKHCNYCDHRVALTTHNLSFKEVSGIHHKEYCSECGYLGSANIPHSVSKIVSVIGDEHTYECECGYQWISTDHYYDRWTNLNKQSHIEACICGATGTTTGAHVVKAGSGVIKKCELCGATINLLDTPVVRDELPMVSVNGSYITSDGIWVIVLEDWEAYLNGSLRFYEQGKLPDES